MALNLSDNEIVCLILFIWAFGTYLFADDVTIRIWIFQNLHVYTSFEILNP